MTSNKPAATSRDEEVRALTDLTIGRAAELAIEHGSSFEMMLDRFITFTAAQTVATYGKAAAVEIMELAVKKIEAGDFDHLEGKGRYIPN